MKPKAEPEVEDESVYVNLSDLPYDLMRFNISAKTGADRREARKALLLKMGAAPPKKQYVNYRTLLKSHKEAKMQALLLPSETANTAVNKRVFLKKNKKKGKGTKKSGKNAKQSENGGKRWRKIKKKKMRN